MTEYRKSSRLLASLLLLGISQFACANSSTSSLHASAATNSLSSAPSPPPSSTIAPPDSTSGTADSTTTASLIHEVSEYSWTYPPASSYVDTVVNYKDTIELMWNANYPDNIPALSIHCWFRNATANLTSGTPLSLGKNPDLIQDIGPIEELYVLKVVNMTEYKAYNPCQFFLEDSVNKTLTRGIVGSAGVEILIDDKTSAKNWTVENEAPVSTAWPTSGARSSIGGERMLGLVVGWCLVLLAFGMSLM